LGHAPQEVPPSEKSVMRMGIIQISRPRSRATTRAMPLSIAPETLTTARKPPMQKRKPATSTVAYSPRTGARKMAYSEMQKLRIVTVGLGHGATGNGP
jgi:hypothetical protein